MTTLIEERERAEKQQKECKEHDPLTLRCGCFQWSHSGEPIFKECEDKNEDVQQSRVD